MKKNKYKILVLSDLNASTSTILKSGISLAKMVDGSIDFLCVKKPSEIVDKDNQLSAIRNINQEHFAIKKKVKNLLTPFSSAYNMDVNPIISYGNVKSEIGNYIDAHKPDIIVMGKRKSKMLKLVGNNITSFVFKKHRGVIMISADENAIEPGKKISLGLLNDMENTFEFAKDLFEHTQKPIKSFKVIKQSSATNESINVNNTENVEYVFEANDNSIDNLSNYLSINNINLLCVNREEGTDDKYAMKFSISNVVNKLNVSMLLIAN